MVLGVGYPGTVGDQLGRRVDVVGEGHTRFWHGLANQIERGVQIVRDGGVFNLPCCDWGGERNPPSLGVGVSGWPAVAAIVGADETLDQVKGFLGESCDLPENIVHHLLFINHAASEISCADTRLPRKAGEDGSPVRATHDHRDVSTLLVPGAKPFLLQG